MKGLQTGKFIVVLLTFVVALSGGTVAWAEQKTTVGGPASVHLDFQITIPTILQLRVGSTGATINTVSCTLSDVPGTGAVSMTSDGDNPVPVEMRALVPSGQAVTLTADSSTALTAGTSSDIPFTEISWTGGGVLGNGTFSGAAGQLLYTYNSSGARSGTYSFQYANINYYDSGVYQGTVTYTLSSP